MDIAPVITPGTTAPSADAAGAVAAVPTAPGQAFSELFAVALNGTDAPIPAITPATAVVALPETPAIPNIDANLSNIPTDVPVPAPDRIAVQSEAPPTSVTDPPESPPEIPSVSWKDAQATAPNAPATRLDQPEKSQDPTAHPQSGPSIDIEIPVDVTTVESLTPRTAVVQSSIVNMTNHELVDAPSIEMNRSEEDASEASAIADAAAMAVSMPPAPMATPSPAANPAPVAELPAPSVKENTELPTASVVASPKSGEVSGETAKARARRTGSDDSVGQAFASISEDDASLSDATPSMTPDAPVVSERVSETVVASGAPVDASPLPKATADALKLAAAPDLGVVPIVTVNTTVAEPAKPVVKDTVAESDVTAVLTVGEVKVQAPEAKGSESRTPEKGAHSTFAEVLVETAVTGEENANTEQQTAQDQPSADPAPVAPATLRSAAVDRPDAGNNRPEIDRHLVVRQVADRIENMVAARPRDGVTIHLEPRDLGTVTLVVKGLSSALDVQVSASDARVREGLEASRNDLAQSLAPRGIELRDVRIVTSSSNGAGSNPGSKDGGSNPNPNPDGRPRHQAPNSHQTGFTQSSTRAVRTSSRGSRRTGGVDLLA